MRLALLLLLAAVPASAETPSQVLDPDTCGAFTAKDLPGRIEMLTAQEPFGDDIDPSDQDAARQWADAVGRACDGNPDRPLSDAAAEAFASP